MLNVQIAKSKGCQSHKMQIGGMTSRYSESGEQSRGRMTPCYSEDETRYSEGGTVSAV